MKVVIAEDDRVTRDLLQKILSRVVGQIFEASNGLEALQRVAEAAPDVVLLDWMMPELDGPETCRQLKADPATAGIPVIFLTAKSQEAEIQRGLSLGASGYVTKPFDALSLGQQVKDIVARKTP